MGYFLLTGDRRFAGTSVAVLLSRRAVRVPLNHAHVIRWLVLDTIGCFSVYEVPEGGVLQAPLVETQAVSHVDIPARPVQSTVRRVLRMRDAIRRPLGTARYLAPPVARRQHIDIALWSMYYAITGSPAFRQAITWLRGTVREYTSLTAHIDIRNWLVGSTILGLASFRSAIGALFSAPRKGAGIVHAELGLRTISGRLKNDDRKPRCWLVVECRVVD